MQAEITEHLGYEKNSSASKKKTNFRNGSYMKRVKGEFSNLDIDVPRDRDSSFEPMIVSKGKSRFTGFDDKIIALYARGMTTRDIKGSLGRDVWCGSCTNVSFASDTSCSGRSDPLAESSIR